MSPLTPAPRATVLAALAAASLQCAHTSAPAPASAPVASAGAASASPPSSAPSAGAWTVHPVALPGSPGSVRMDYLAYAPTTHALWIPAGNTARVDVLHAADESIATVDGFATVEREMRGARRTIGPSAVAIGEGVAYIGNRADSSVCAVDLHTLQRRGCVTLPAQPDGVAYDPATHEVWVTAPSIRSLVVLHETPAGALAPSATVQLEGSPEGYAVDAERGVFYTNLEDGDRTLAINATTHRLAATWRPGCGEAGPRGLAMDHAHGWLFVACTDHSVTLDTAHDGAVLSSIATGAGVDAIDYAPAERLLYVASGATGTLRIVHVDEHGALSPAGEAATVRGARSVVVGEGGRAYVADSEGGRIFVVDPPASH